MTSEQTRPHNPTNGRFEKQITEEELLLAVAECNGLGTGDIANHMGFEISGVRRALRLAEGKNMVRQTFINKRVSVWWVCLSA